MCLFFFFVFIFVHFSFLCLFVLKPINLFWLLLIGIQCSPTFFLYFMFLYFNLLGVNKFEPEWTSVHGSIFFTQSKISFQINLIEFSNWAKLSEFYDQLQCRAAKSPKQGKLTIFDGWWRQWKWYKNARAGRWKIFGNL